MVILELYNGSYIRAYDSENPPKVRQLGEPSTFHLTCFGHFDEAANVIWTQLCGKKFPIPLGFKPEVKDYRDER